MTSAVAFEAQGRSSFLASDGRNLRVAEKVVLGFLAYALIAFLIYPLPLREWLLVGGLNLAAAGAIILLGANPKPRAWAAALRDWFPTVLILLAYRESGLLLKPDPTHHLDYLFVQWDWLLFENPWIKSLLAVTAPWPQRYLELSYLFCYPLVPLGFAALVLGTCARTMDPSASLAGASLGGATVRLRSPSLPSTLLRDGERSRTVSEVEGSPAPTKRRDSVAIDHFWTTVLLATLTCYAVYPFFPLTPPRVLFHDLPGPVVEPLLRKANFWILNQYGVQACIFPSGHVAAVTATALAVRAYLPRLGVAFLIAAASVAVATVYGRYHYAADALAGALVGLLAFLISSRIHRV